MYRTLLALLVSTLSGAAVAQVGYAPLPHTSETTTADTPTTVSLAGASAILLEAQTADMLWTIWPTDNDDTLATITAVTSRTVGNNVGSVYSLTLSTPVTAGAQYQIEDDAGKVKLRGVVTRMDRSLATFVSSYKPATAIAADDTLAYAVPNKALSTNTDVTSSPPIGEAWGTFLKAGDRHAFTVPAWARESGVLLFTRDATTHGTLHVARMASAPTIDF